MTDYYSVSSLVAHALRDRLKTITLANGYQSDVKAVYHDKIPMGLELNNEDLPALFLIDEGCEAVHEQQVINFSRAFRVQIIDVADALDEQMTATIRDIGKAVFANSPTAQVQDQFRVHERVYWVQYESDDTDLHMIDGNRIASVRLIVHYRTRPYDL